MIVLSPRREVGEFRRRYKWMAAFVVVVFSILFGRLVQLQLVQRQHWGGIAKENITKTITLPATRGLIRDVRGQVIAENRPSYNVFVTPQLIDPERDLERMDTLMRLDEEERQALRRRLADVRPHRTMHRIEMFRDVSRDRMAALETHETDLPGVDVVAVPVRNYPFKTLAAHAVGYLNEVNAEDLERFRDLDYRAGEVIGRTGIEQSWEQQLRGTRGVRRILVDARGRQLAGESVLGSTRDQVRAPISGHDLVVSLDMTLMRAVERAFRGHPSGGAVVVDVRTGRLRAMFSKPSYDLNEMSGRLTSDRFREMSEDPFRPLIDKTVYESYFPGSTFKPITELAARDQGAFDPHQRVECVGYYEIGTQRQRCTSAHGDVDMQSAMIQSCNVYFWKLAEQVGLERLNQMAREFGLGAKTGIGINSEASGFLASRKWYEQHYGRYRVGYTLNTAIGQGNTRSTLLQIAMMYAAFANGGRLFVPQLVEEVRKPDGTLVQRVKPKLRRRVKVPAEVLESLRESLRRVVNDPEGTAYDARVEDGVQVAGKTGTAEVTPGSHRRGMDSSRAWYFNRSHAWFAGFAPAHEPEVAIVILVEHGGAGGRTAAPVAMQILQDYFSSRRPAKERSLPSTDTSSFGGVD